MKLCPFCAEDIQDAAIVCKHCGRDVVTAASPVGAPSVATPPLSARRVPGRWIVAAVGTALLLGGGVGAAATGMLPGAPTRVTSAVPAAPPADGAPAAEASSAGSAAGPAAEPELAPAVVTELVDESAVEIGVERWFHVGFTVPDAGESCRLTGRVLGLTGGNKDVEVYVLGADDYLNWRTNPHGEQWRYAGVFSGPRQTATTLDVVLPGPGEYYLVISNRFSVATAKNVQASARVTCESGGAEAAGV